MIISFLPFLYGLLIGSFLNVVIYRVPKKEDIVFTPSHCMSCGNRIKWYDLIPVASFLVLGGKCRYCKEKVSVQYPLIELSNGMAYLGIFYLHGLTWRSVMLCILFSFMLVIAIIDLKHQIIPNSILLVMMIVGMLYVVFISKTYLDSVIGFFLVSGLFYIIAIITKGKMGGGDIKLMAVAGFILGWKLIFTAMFIGSLIGTIIGLILIKIKINEFKQMIPFGPYLCFGIMISGLYGEFLIHWYIKWILF